MQLAEATGLSYGKIYRILNGTLEKPGPAYLKKIAAALGLNYSQLLDLSGVIATKEESVNNVFSYPILSWDYCYLAYPFNEKITSGLSDEHVSYHRQIKDGFCLEINATHELIPFFCNKDIIVCEPHARLKPLDNVLYWDHISKRFRFGLISDQDGDMVIQSLHQELLNCNIGIQESIQNPIAAKIVTVKYA